ncbi:iron-sulfur protein I [Schizosaccharomyces cryophilus OY26]|uniref:Iron-sulfur assembly protein 1 n=1 Tax=Schizosaccharomyces cryophilus (strain OY26 / ATCC MYA-4695 / CBS 11777 / NBRC 106824 / NRRL Y48691) TaxID=653667 RepID=S9VX86_SCHCR|nr:iron-sulfur protein I [Schizosaccharomyces cryophilus OY26]EPY50610.1 iron-sulfur protein I [Schizosaccharomyces cryophilus OY26]
MLGHLWTRQISRSSLREGVIRNFVRNLSLYEIHNLKNPHSSPPKSQNIQIPPPTRLRGATPSNETSKKELAPTRHMPRKNVIKLTPDAVNHLRNMLNEPAMKDKLLRIGVKQKGCAGQAYSLEYIAQPEKFDEIVEQDGIRIIVARRALLQIIGSVMDYKDDELQSRFIFTNPNIKSTCGCGESFSTIK